ncbi:MAG: Hsp70 family protein [Selenomonadaceae bacterium]|nr:Hsp70 family protein [Selenomonadaceae bacterium]
MAEFLYGVDFGACNLKCVRVGERRFLPVRLNTIDDGSYHTPTVIFYGKSKDGELQKIIGQAALNKSEPEPENLISGLKRKLEEKSWRQFLPALEREIAAPEVVEDVFQKIYTMATRNRREGDIARAVVTVPVIFTKNQRKLIADAADKAGFKVEAVVNESFAALFSAKNLSDSLNVVFDFGGSTLDVSIIKITGNEIHELAASGIRLGGLDIDRDIFEKILKPKVGDILDAAWDCLNKEDFQMDFVREMKESLYSEDADEEVSGEFISGYSGKKDFDKIILTRAEIDDLLERENYGGKIIALLDELFDQLSEQEDCFDKSDVTKIWAVGGSLRIPYFRTLLENYFGKELFDAAHYDFEDVTDFLNGLEDKYLVVAGGAANFLQKKNTVTAINAIPYRICYKLKKNLQAGLAKNAPASFETLAKKIDLSELDSAGWKIELYQSFSDDANFSDAAYLESVALNPALYEKKESPWLQLKMMRDGRLRLRVSERRILDDGESDSILVEEIFIRPED